MILVATVHANDRAARKPLTFELRRTLWLESPTTMIVEVTLLIASGLGNLAWDITGRRVRARQRRRERRARRRVSLPAPATDDQARDPFEFVGANLATQVENLDAARSTLLDVDVAEEMTRFSSAQVLQQAATAMLAQANQLPQNLLRLLQG